MQPTDPKNAWHAYRTSELTWIEPMLGEHNITLDKIQPHTGGERYLMQAVTTTSGRKLILLGKRTNDNLRVVVKATSDPGGVRELTHECLCRNTLHTIDFAYGVFYSPHEVLFSNTNGRCLSIVEFIEQEQTFLERTLKEQFSYALASFTAQESAHATTHTHLKDIRSVYDTYITRDYRRTFDEFLHYVGSEHNDGPVLASLKEARSRLETPDTIERYCGFLTHTDFVPHNFRIRDNKLYLLDHSSLRFGNKHEGWARFLNFMTLYHPALEDALLTYVLQNRAPEEHASLQLMRVYRLGELIRYYVRAAKLSTDNLQTLNTARIRFWSDVLTATLNNTAVSDTIRTTYIKTRDQLRSKDEKQRQQGLH